MTPKDKAKELVDKYAKLYYDLEYDYYDDRDKQCALIAVDEILNTFIDIDPKLNYWQEVKQEIEKL